MVASRMSQLTVLAGKTNKKTLIWILTKYFVQKDLKKIYADS